MITDAQLAAIEAMRGELMLLTPRVRKDPRQVEALLEEGFSAVTMNGVRLCRGEVLAFLGEEEIPKGTPRVATSQMRGVLLAPDVVQLSYLGYGQLGPSRRLSIWRLRMGRWRIVYHQRTALEEPDAPTNPWRGPEAGTG